MKPYLYFAQALIGLSLGANVLLSQTTGSELKTFEADGLRFSYPATWTLTNQSSPDFQFQILSQGSSPRMIGIISSRESFTNWDKFLRYEAMIQARYFDSVKKRLETSGSSLETEDECLDFHGRKVTGTRFTGTYKGEPAVGETYAFGLGNRILGLFYLRVEREQITGNSAWTAVLESVSLDGTNSVGPRLNLKNGGKLNGKALRLVKPPYPSGGMRLSGVVRVEVVIDERGNVSSANAVSGSPLFHSNAVDAARKSSFPPTLICGQPVKVKGTIQYSFIP
jgi:TonB family protein